MERLTRRLHDAESALARLGEVLAIEAPTDVERDAAIQRFEFTFEAVWKAASVSRCPGSRAKISCAIASLYMWLVKFRSSVARNRASAVSSSPMPLSRQARTTAPGDPASMRSTTAR